ncbi:MAG: hypothetical protein COW24_05840 [Candidatus Kerfeldbacteria bacterium CG15_BIG_FIL_POST_REV_8_21_14_020_45_12]|uniref:Carboxypeptidase regulatory-like domain-containing protein n=1 Tax=Candidatus Kerfeldbacteria bacterium CG15_BIG_FIL_POST_REV_8_21_14_020_45_12 TaxID=2014247 RepID=A0A2M7H286_9BACT|nr:MAG: hypothetical protein COW24_05840 [Candidatus Kerfeldbacteria bacterium CG15_BIG_FIL_POST_REV_8_21_14_020_45_12]PJA93725.1 MAG: hypothetical protein CO132_01645 [Candidatus Kerfeldbacteria bacterium CG_4_9_14_3_um_filter_45_8]
MKQLPTNQAGTSLIEALMTIAIFTMVSISLYMMIWLALHLLRDDQARLDAIAIAQTKIEELRNAPYESVGTSGGIPSGAFSQLETVVRNNRDYHVETEIIYIDDVYDGVAPIDTVNTDYKQAEVSVTWQGQYVSEPVVLSTIFAPEGIETTAGGGTLWVEAVDSDEQPVAGATILVTNTTTVPTVNITSTTDINGRYILPGAPAATQSYHVELSKSGYSSSQTYPEDLDSNPNPDPHDLSVIALDTTTLVMVIDSLGELNIHLERRDDGTALIDIPVQITGSQRIGTDLSGADIPKYSELLTSDSSGDIVISSLESDIYTIVIDEDTTTFDLAGYSQSLPLNIAPGASETVTLLLADAESDTALLSITDISGTPIVGATVDATNADFSTNLTETTDANGQVYFSPLSQESFTVEVTAAGYEIYSTSIEVSGDMNLTLPLTAS